MLIENSLANDFYSMHAVAISTVNLSISNLSPRRSSSCDVQEGVSFRQRFRGNVFDGGDGLGMETS